MGIAGWKERKVRAKLTPNSAEGMALINRNLKVGPNGLGIGANSRRAGFKILASWKQVDRKDV